MPGMPIQKCFLRKYTFINYYYDLRALHILHQAMSPTIPHEQYLHVPVNIRIQLNGKIRLKQNKKEKEKKNYVRKYPFQDE